MLHHTYIIFDDDDCVKIDYHENWHHAMSDTDFDKNMPGFTSLVNSISFLK